MHSQHPCFVAPKSRSSQHYQISHLISCNAVQQILSFHIFMKYSKYLPYTCQQHNTRTRQCQTFFYLFEQKNYLYTKIMYTKLVHIKIYLESFVSIYHLYHLFGIICKNIFYKLNITSMNNWFISKRYLKMPFWVFSVFSCNLTYCFSIFFSNRNT